MLLQPSDARIEILGIQMFLGMLRAWDPGSEMIVTKMLMVNSGILGNEMLVGI